MERQDAQGWGTKVIDRLAADLQAEFPEQRGWTRRTLHYMRKLAERWPTEGAFVQQPAAQMPWTSVTTLLDGCDDRVTSDWYAARAVAEGWSRGVLADRIKGQLHLREGSAPSNFATTLNLRQPHRASTVGILICAGRNESVVRYSLASATAPLAVSEYTYSQLPEEALPAVPDEHTLTEIVEHPVVGGRQLTIAEYIDELDIEMGFDSQ